MIVPHVGRMVCLKVRGVIVSGIFLTGLTGWDPSHILGAPCEVRKNSLYGNHVRPTSNVD
jgi:hypothetical protein